MAITAKKNRTYTLAKAAAYAGGAHVINDSIGRVFYVAKYQSKIKLENSSGVQNDTLKTPTIDQLPEISKNIPTNLACFYNFLSTNSKYLRETIEDKKVVDITPLTSSTINIYNIQLPGAVPVLEVRNYDPWTLLGTNSAPYDAFKSIAITHDEVAAIISQIKTSGAHEKNLFFDFDTVTAAPPATGYRPYFQTTLKIVGSSSSSSRNSQNSLTTSVVIYSIDKQNWTSVAYASAAASKITGNSWNNYLWDNQIVPSPISSAKPFGNYLSNVTTTLQTIINEANNLPATNDGKGARLLNTPIRDYIYQGDIDKLTFEIAFRLPFFMERINDIPYDDANGTKRFNNPYYTKFDSWFGYARTLRTTAGIVQLNEAGRLTTDYDGGYHDYNSNFQNLLMIAPQTRKDYFVTNHVPAYMGKNFEYENPDYIDVATVPWPAGSVSIQGAARDLTDLVNANIITADKKLKLESGDIIYAKIPDGTYAGESITNGLVSKRKLSKKAQKGSFYIYTYSWKASSPPNNSGLTFGFGWDIGANNDPAQFQDYTGYTIPQSGAVHDIVNAAFGKKRIDALETYFTNYDSVWKSIKAPFERAVTKTMPKMRNAQYLKGAIKFMAKNYIVNGVKTSDLYLRTFQPDFDYFFNDGSSPYFNEIEKTFILSQSWNTGNGSLNQKQSPKIDKKTGAVLIDFKARAKRAIQALNTHDITYLKYAVKNSGITHSDKILSLLENSSIYNYFKAF